MKQRWILGYVLFFAAFGLYLHGAYPSVSVGDSGEFITAGGTLGIPHSPGYPSYVLLAKCVQLSIPWGNVGYRVNLLSALCGALAVVMLFLVTSRLSISPEIGFCTALLFMVSRAQVVNAQASEVFALHALLCGAVMWAVLSDRWLLAAFLLGWGLGNHQTILFLVPAAAMAYMARPPSDRISILSIGACVAGGLSIYVFLYLRAAKSPVLNAGDPETFERLWRVLTRADYGSLTLALGETPARTLESVGLQMKRFIHGLCDQITWVGFWGGLFGTVVCMRRQFVPILTLAVAFVFLGPGFFLLGNLPFDAQSSGLLERFYIVPTFFWVLLLATGIQFLAERQRWLAWIAFILPLFLFIQEVDAFSFRGDFRAYAYGRNNLRTLPPQTLFIMDGGDDTFYTLAYLVQIEKRRSDVQLHDRGGVVFPGLYGEDFRSLTREAKGDRRQQIEQAVLASHRSLYYSTMNEQILSDKPLVQRGILYEARREFPATGHEDKEWLFYDLRGIAPWMPSTPRVSKDYRTRALLPFYAYQRSVEAARDAEWEDALAFASAAHALGPDVVWLFPNLMHNVYQWAQTTFLAGRFDLAGRMYRSVLSWNPKESTAWANLGAIEERNQHLEAAITYYQKAIEIDPSSESAHYNLAVAYWKLSNWPKVVEELNRVLSMNPTHTAARKYLTHAEAQLKSSPRP